MTPTMSMAGTRRPFVMPDGVKGGLGYETAAAGTQRFGLILLTFFVFLSFSRLSDFFLPWLHLPLIASASALAFCVLTRGIERTFQTKVGALLIAFTAWMLVCLPFSVWKGGTWSLLSETWYKSLLSYFLVAGLLLTSKDCRRIMYTLGFSSVVIVGLALAF